MKALKWCVWAGGEKLPTLYDTADEAAIAAEDVKGDYPDMEVDIDVVPNELHDAFAADFPNTWGGKKEG